MLALWIQSVRAIRIFILRQASMNAWRRRLPGGSANRIEPAG
jgi:hypothetical protein